MADAPPRHRRIALALAGSALLGACFVWLLRRGTLPVIPATEDLARVPAWAPPVYALLFLLALYLRAVRWYWLLLPLQPVPMRRVLLVSFIGFGALILLPFRMGELVRPALIRQQGRLSGWAATGTIAAERVIDGLSLSVILLLALLFSRPLDPLPDRIGDLPIPAAIVPQMAYVALVLFFGVFALMGLFYWRRAFARRLVERVLAPISPRFAAFLAAKVEALADGLSFLPRARYSGPFLAVTMLHWVVNAAGLWMLCASVGLPSMTFGSSCVLMGVLGLGLLVPNAPGFFGAFQISIYAGLAMYLEPAAVMKSGSVAVFWLYVIQMGTTLVFAALALALARVTPAAALTAAEASSPAEDAPRPAENAP